MECWRPPAAANNKATNFTCLEIVRPFFNVAARVIDRGFGKDEITSRRY